MSNRSEILEIVKTRLQAIRLGSGYATDAGATVFMGEAPSLGPDDPTTAIAIVIGDDEPRYQGEQILIRLPLTIAALAQANLDDPWGSIEAILGDIKQAMEVKDRRMGRALKSPLTRGSTRTLAREPGSTTVGIGITYLIDYAECWGTP
jgi:hypothetical protein